MESAAEARRAVALEVAKLAQDFEKSDEAAFRRIRIACWGIAVAVTVVTLGILTLGGDWRYLSCFWTMIVGLTWLGYVLTTGRQRKQTERLKALAGRWLNEELPTAV
jgi:fatty acid desaturase